MRPEVPEGLKILHAFGLKKVVMLSGELPPPPTPTHVNDWKENWSIFGYIGTPVLMVVLLLFFVSKTRWRNGLDDQLARWKVTCHLNDAVVSQLRQIKLDFHGLSNPITTPIQHSSLEIREHHNAMAISWKRRMEQSFCVIAPLGAWGIKLQATQQANCEDPSGHGRGGTPQP